MQVDKGAIKAVIGGSNIMAPGLTSPGFFILSLNTKKKYIGGKMDDVAAGTVVVRNDVYISIKQTRQYMLKEKLMP